MDNLSREELLKIIASQQEQIKEFDEKFHKQAMKISSLERAYAELQEEHNKLLKRIENKIHIIKVNNHNKYYSTKESSFIKEQREDSSSPINEVEVNLAKKKGRPKGSKNFSNINLESLAKETVTLDIAKDDNVNIIFTNFGVLTFTNLGV